MSTFSASRYKTTQEIIKDWVEKKRPAKLGPYSNSRLNRCDFEFWKHYQTDEQPTEITRYGTNDGLAVHDVCELDVRMRTSKARGEWLSHEELVDYFVDQNPRWSEFQISLTEMLATFRQKFNINLENYVGSEERLGATLGLNGAEFFDDDTCWYRGIIDYLEIDKHGTARIVDFKNYPSIHGWKDFNDPQSSLGRQLMGYMALVMANYPSVQRAKYQVYYNQFGVTNESVEKIDGEWQEKFFTREEVANWWRTVQRRMIAVERRSPENFNPQPSRKRCQYCSYMYTCPFWVNRDPEKEYVLKDHKDAREALGEYGVLDEHRKRLRDALDTFAGEYGTIETETGAWYGYEPYTKKSPKVPKVLEFAKKASDAGDITEFIRFLSNTDLSFTKGSTDKFVGKLPDELKEVAEEEAYDVRETTRKQSSF